MIFLTFASIVVLAVLVGIHFRALRRRDEFVEAIRTSEERFQLISKATRDVIWDWDFTNNQVWVNDAFEGLFGTKSKTGNTIDAATWRRRIHAEDFDGVELSLYGAIVRGDDSWSCEYRIARADGTYAHVLDRGRLLRDREGRAVRMLGAMMDISARKESEEKLRALARLAHREQLITYTDDGIVGMDLDGRATFLNPAALRVLGWSEGELDGAMVHDTVHCKPGGTLTPATECAICRASLSGEAVLPTQRLFWRRDGSSIPVEFSVTPMRDEEQRLSGAVLTFRDLSARRAVELMKNHFLSIVSHELRTPLTAIHGSLGLLNGGVFGHIPGEAQDMLTIAMSNTDRLVRLINDILDIEKMESGMFTIAQQKCRADELMHNAAKLMRTTADRLGISISVTAPPATIWADADRTLQVLTNLVANALKFSPRDSTIQLSAKAEGRHLVFSVKDQGRGIPADKLDVIFERFRQVDESDARKSGGVGLGLAICRNIVRQHGGEITVSSEVGVGSEFQFTMPLIATEASAPAPVASKKILVCDDDPAILAVMEPMLRSHGYEVATALSGATLLETVKDARPDLILLDLLMPGITGWDVIGRLKRDSETAGIPVIVLSIFSATGSDPAEEQIDGWVQKPVIEDRMLETIEQALGTTTPEVLVVEDDDIIAKVVITSLHRKGLRTIRARDGREAIEIAQTAQPDLVVLDLGLPQLDGFGVVEWLRLHHRLRNVPLIVYSGSDVSVSDRTRLTLGPTEFLTKGKLSPAEFQRRVLELLRESAQAV